MEQALSSSEISELICTRMSHDIIGNVGAVSNAVELLEDGDMDFMDDIKSILKVSSFVLSSRMKFFRMAFGLDNANVSNLALVENIICDYLKTVGNKDFPIAFEMKAQSPDLGRILMLEAMLGADLIVRGGKISVVQSGYKLYLKVSSAYKLSAEKMNAVASIVAGETGEKAAQYAPVYYLCHLIEKAGLKMRANISEAFELIIE